MTRAQTRPKTGESLPRAQDIEQPDLFGAQRPSRLRAVARSTDPETSHAAAKRAQRSISLKQLAVLDLFQRAEMRHLRITGNALDGLIDETLLLHYRSTYYDGSDWWPLQTDSGLRTRRSELVTLQYLHDTHRKRLGDACGPSIVWALTDRGRMLNVQAFRATLENKAAVRAQHRSKKRAGDLAP